VEHDKLKSYHFATDRDSERNEWVDTLTQAATLQNDADHPRCELSVFSHRLHWIIALFG